MTHFAPAHIFLVTYGRSGSTLLQNLLNALPGTCIRGENAGVTSRLAQAAQLLDGAQPARSVREHGIATSPAHPWFGAEGHDPAGFAAMLAAALNTHVLRPPPGTLRAGFKEIRWHEPAEAFAPSLDFLAAHFPETRFVFNLRAHDAVLKSGWWAKQDPDKARAILERAEALYAAYQARHPHLCVTLRYEDYTRDADALRPLFDHIGVGFDGDMVRAVLEQRLTHLQTPTGQRHGARTPEGTGLPRRATRPQKSY